jgi:hypothetical protein
MINGVDLSSVGEFRDRRQSSSHPLTTLSARSLSDTVRPASGCSS